MIEWLEAHQLPCFFREIWGIQCPGCGFQTALLLLLKGNIQAAVVSWPGIVPLFAFGLFLMIYPSITVQGIILLFGVALAVMGAAGLVSYFRQRSVRYRDSGTLMSAVFYVIIALIACIFPKVIAGFFSVVLGVVLILLAIVNVVRAFGLRAFGSSIWIAVLATAVLVGIGGVLIVVNPWGASMTFVLVLGATFIVNGAVDLFIEWYTRDSEKKAGGISRR